MNVNYVRNRFNEKIVTVWQELFDKYANKIDYKQDVLNLEDLKECQNAFVILDNLMFADPKFLAKIYSVYSHHFRFSVVMTVQNLFDKDLRETSLNSQIIILFKNCSDTNQIAHFMQQIYPKTYKSALEAYEDAVSWQRGYLMIDLRCKRTINRGFVQEFFHRRHSLFLSMNRLRKTDQWCVCFKSLTSLQKSILDKASPELIRCTCDCAHNVLQGNASLSRDYKKKLS